MRLGSPRGESVVPLSPSTANIRSSTCNIRQAQRPSAGGADSRLTAAPEYTRSEADAWLCSLRLGVLDGNISSKSLIRAFGWERPVPGLVLAVQLVALSKKFEVGTTTVWFMCWKTFRRDWLERGFGSVTLSEKKFVSTGWVRMHEAAGVRPVVFVQFVYEAPAPARFLVAH